LEVVQIELEDVFGRVRGLEPARIAPVEQALADRVAGLGEVDRTALHGTLGTYLALRGLAQEARLDGLAVRCWPQFFTDLGCAACGALSMLNDELLPCSCEADIQARSPSLSCRN
jgi:L-fucose isomerase-like protein